MIFPESILQHEDWAVTELQRETMLINVFMTSEDKWLFHPPKLLLSVKPNLQESGGKNGSGSLDHLLYGCKRQCCHAVTKESDPWAIMKIHPAREFYPRSDVTERRNFLQNQSWHSRQFFFNEISSWLCLNDTLCFHFFSSLWNTGKLLSFTSSNFSLYAGLESDAHNTPIRS